LLKNEEIGFFRQSQLETEEEAFVQFKNFGKDGGEQKEGWDMTHPMNYQSKDC
jgi:hypothetical protein